MVLVISQADLKTLLTMKDAIQAVEEGYAQLSMGNVVLPPRPKIDVGKHRGMLLVMPGYVGGMDALGLKMVTEYRENPVKYNLPTIIGTVLLADAKTGSLVAVMDGTYLTAMRTGGATGVATKFLARDDSETAGIFGSGAQARTQLVAICTVRSIKKAKVYDVVSESAKRYAEEMSRSLGIDVKQADSPMEVVKGCDILASATTSKQPVFQGEWLEEGAHINGIGSHTPDAREVDTATVKRAKVVVDSYEASVNEAGDIIIPISEHSISKEHIYAEIGEIILGRKKGRISDSEITFFKSVGLAVQDLSTASKVYQLAREKGVGVEISL